jgi:hypothetical protein
MPKLMPCGLSSAAMSRAKSLAGARMNDTDVAKITISRYEASHARARRACSCGPGRRPGRLPRAAASAGHGSQGTGPEQHECREGRRAWIEVRRRILSWARRPAANRSRQILSIRRHQPGAMISRSITSSLAGRLSERISAEPLVKPDDSHSWPAPALERRILPQAREFIFTTMKVTGEGGGAGHNIRSG